MRHSINMDAIKLALIQAIQVDVPEEIVCRVCEYQFTHLHRIDIRGVTTIHLCEQCVEEFREEFKRREEVGVEHIFTNSIGLLFGQRQEENHIEIDYEDFGSYYGVAQYQVDHLV